MAALTPIQRTIRVGEPPQAAQKRFGDHFTVWLGQGKFYATQQTADTLVYSRRKFYTWQIVVAILLFPLGLIALAAEKQEEQISVVFRGEGDGKTDITINGVMSQDAATAQFMQRLNEFDPATRPAPQLDQPQPT